MKQRNKYAIYGLVALVLIGGWYRYYASLSGAGSSQMRITDSDLVTVWTGTLKSTLQAVGTSKAVSTQKLQFNINGDFLKIASWNVKVGDKVKKGQVLASLDTRDVDNDIRSAELSLKNAQASYDKLVNGTKDYQFTQLENSITSDKLKLASLPEQLQNLQMERDSEILQQNHKIEQTKQSIELAKQKIATLQDDIENTQAQSVSTIESSDADLASTLSNASVSAQNELSDAKNFITDMETSALHLDKTDNEVPIEFSAKDPNAKTKALIALDSFKAAVDTYARVVGNKDFTTTGSVNELLWYQDSLSNSAVSTADAFITSLDASINSASFSRQTIDSIRSTVTAARTKFSSYLTNSASTKQKIASASDPELVRKNVANTIASKNQSILEAKNWMSVSQATLLEQQKALAKLQSDYEIKIQQMKDSFTTTQWDVKSWEQNLASLKNGPTQAERTSALTQIEQAQLSLAKAKKKKEDYQIIAWFDGVVSISNGKAGEISTADTNVTVEVPNLYEIDVLVDQLDVVRVKSGQETIVTFDSYPGRTFTGSVGEIDATPVTNQGVVSYTVKIFLKTPDDVKLYNNMTATVTITLDEKNNTILVPTMAITNTNGRKTVRIFKNGRPVQQEVTTGDSEGEMTEILSGLDVGDRIVNRQFRLSTGSGTTTSGFSLFGGLGRNAGGGSGWRNFGGGGGNGNQASWGGNATPTPPPTQ